MAGEWETLPVADAPLNIIDGDRGVNYPKQDDFAPSGDCLFLNTGNVTTRGFSFTDRSFITKEKDALLRKGKLQRHDVVLTTRGTVGNVALFDDTVPFEHIRINSGMVLLRADESKLLPRFLYQFVRSPIFKEQVAALSTGSAQPQLPIRDIRRIELTLPPLAEQKAIAQILGALDDKIELNRRMNVTLEAMARALFQGWFVDFDPVRAKLDGRKPSGIDAATAALFPLHLHETVLGKTPIGWKVLTFAEVLTPHSSRVGDETVPEFSATVTGLSSRDERFKKQLSKSQSKNKRIVAGDLVFGFSREIINFGLMRDPVGAVSPVYEVFKINLAIIEPDLLERLFRFNMPYYMDILKPGAREGKPIDRNYLQRKHLLIPDIAVQRAFLAAIKPWTEKVKNNKAESRTLATLRDTLLPKLLSGEVQISQPTDSTLCPGTTA